jgi:uncharacterized protein YjdB
MHKLLQDVLFYNLIILLEEFIMKIKHESKIITFTIAVFFTMACLTQVFTKNIYATSNVQELLITEVMPMSQVNNDAYEYIEVYNNSDSNVDLKDYKLPLQNIDITTSKVIAPKGILVVCTKGSTTLSDFNTFYNTSITQDKYITLPFVDEVLSNTLNTSIMISKDDSTVVVRAQYNAADFQTKKSVTYRYTETGIDMLRLGQSQSPTPGSVSLEQVPQSGTKVTGITLDRSLITMDVNQAVALYATIAPATAINKAIVWTSNDSSIVGINQNGVLISKAEGVAYIYATTVDGGLVAVCTVIVRKVPVTGITLNKTSSSIEVGQSIVLTASVTPTTASNKSVNFETSNSNIASVDSNGTVVGKAAGEAIITVTTRDGSFKDRCFITVKGNGTPNIQELLITEVMPMSQTNNDAYEYIELYNNSDRNIDLKNYKLPLQNIDITTSKVISPKGILVICTKGSTTLSDFNTFYSTSLTPDKYITLPFVNEVLSNDLNTSILIAKDDSNVVVRAQYYAADFQTKKSVTYKYAETGIDMLRLAQNQSPTPGSVSSEQVPQGGIKVTGITLDKSLITMDVNQNAVICATVAPATATNKAITWISSNSSIVEISQKGVLTSKAEGVVYVSATTVDGGIVAFCTVVVKKIPVTGITLDKTSASIEIGKSITLKSSVTPANATNKLVSFESSNSNIASVDSTGKVVAKAVGQAIITVTTKDGNFKCVCVITVKNNENTNNEVLSIRLNKTSIQIKEGKFEQLTPIITPGNLKKTGLVWKSSNENVAYVTEDGRVFGKNEGSAVITVTTSNGAKATCNVQVTKEKEKKKGKGKGRGHSALAWND